LRANGNWRRDSAQDFAGCLVWLRGCAASRLCYDLLIRPPWAAEVLFGPEDEIGADALIKGKLRLHSLDALRGIAALAVVCWHWQHMGLLGSRLMTWRDYMAPPIARANEPFHELLWLFYQRGGAAVDIFFIISGFIFFWLYQEKLATRKLSLLDFGARRLSRLYPLHLFMLFIVAALQALFFRRTGQYFVYGANSLKTFIGSLLFYQRGGDHAAFNGPEWSVTIEIVMYLVFCALARWNLLRKPWVPLAMVAASLVLYRVKPDIMRGFSGFFLGGLAYQAFMASRKLPGVRPLLLGMAALCAVGWGLVVVDTYFDGNIASAIEHWRWIQRLGLVNYAVLYGLFPMTVLTLALHEDVFGARYNVLSWLGELSYSSYLLHFPLQLIFALTVAFGVVSADVVRSGPALVIYFLILIPMSILVFRAFEAPAQNVLRGLWAQLKLYLR
jgi:peptidoglycan/LPS O-acetylase OafA/YrhL